MSILVKEKTISPVSETSGKPTSKYHWWLQSISWTPGHYNISAIGFSCIYAPFFKTWGAVCIFKWKNELINQFFFKFWECIIVWSTYNTVVICWQSIKMCHHWPHQLLLVGCYISCLNLVFVSKAKFLYILNFWYKVGVGKKEPAEKQGSQ